MPVKKDIDDISREEDFRDYDDRNIDEGWPYADQPGAGSGPVDNAAYGSSGGNGDRTRNPGFLVDQAGSDGAEAPLGDSLKPGTEGLEEADDLEERVTDAIEALAIIDMNLLDVHVDRGVVTLSGQVDDAAVSRRIVHAAQHVEGTRRVINHLRLAGIDGRIPDED